MGGKFGRSTELRAELSTNLSGEAQARQKQERWASSEPIIITLHHPYACVEEELEVRAWETVREAKWRSTCGLAAINQQWVFGGVPLTDDETFDENGIESGASCTVVRCQDGDNRYDGDLVDGMAQGRGTMHFADGSTYIGQFHQDRMHGSGEFTPVGDSEMFYYKGQW